MKLCQDDILEIRKAVYSDPGYFVFRGFLDEIAVDFMRSVWTADISYQFHDFIRNMDVVPGSPKYMYNRPTPDDFVYCTQIWNMPVDDVLHSKAIELQMLRNQVEGKPGYYGLHESTGKALQYRVSRTVSPEAVVKQHADFFEEFRGDPMDDHEFDPSRLQATLFLSDYGRDYDTGGFKLWNEDKTEFRLFGKDVEIGKGDIAFWRYSLPHEVAGVNVLDERIGFLRVIFPMFDIPGYGQ